MEETQRFRLVETGETKEIPIRHVHGESIIYWQDIEEAFPGFQEVRDDNSVIAYVKGSDHQRIMPYSIKSCQGLILDVSLSTSVENVRVNPGGLNPLDGETDAQFDGIVGDGVISALDINRHTPDGRFGRPSRDVNAVSKATLFQQIVTGALRNARESEIEQRFISFLAPEVQETVRASPDIYQAFAKVIKDGYGGLGRADLRQELSGPFQKLEAMLAKNIELQEAMYAKQEEVKQLQEQVLDNQKEMKQLQERALEQLAVLQSRVQAVLTQTYELHEYPIPRLFVVLPQDPSLWDAVNPFSNKFRLYFLCECGEHTKSINSSTKIPRHIHLAKHDGYDITRPSDFFQQYGSYVLTILKMLKFGITAAGIALPALSHLITVESIDQATAGLKKLQENIVHGMDQAISHIDSVLGHDGVAVDKKENRDALEGADLRKLETFLYGADGNKVMGNLYRIVTNEGHVKWVCIDHYRENYNQPSVEGFRLAVDSVGGSFDENQGLVRVTLRSRALAEHFYSALGKARSVHELYINLVMEGNMSDLEALQGALKISGVSILHLDLKQFRLNLGGKLSLTSTRYDILVRVVEHPKMKLVHIGLPKDLNKLSSPPSKKPSHLHKLSFDMATGVIGAKDFGLLSEVLKTNSTLTTLDLTDNSIGENGARALSEALKTNSTLTTLYLTRNSIGESGARALSEALKTNSTLTTLDLTGNSIEDNGAQALSDALRINSTLTTLYLSSISIGENGAQALSEALKTNSTLTTLYLSSISIGENGARALSEALKTNSTLTTLDLNFNSIGGSGAQALSDALRINSTLTTLDLKWNNIGNNGAQALSEALKTNSTLTTLDLTRNLIEDNGAQALSDALRINSTLTTLDLMLNNIGNNGAQALSEVLKTNSNLTTLDLTRNSIEDNGAQALSEALETNSTLTTLYLSFNSIGGNGAQALSEALKTNSTLTTLYLSSISIGENGARALSDALKTNSTLTTLDLTDNSIGEHGAQALSKALKTNTRLKLLW